MRIAVTLRRTAVGSPAMIAGLLLLTLAACTPESPPVPPIAAALPETLRIHGDERIDPYFWLRERDNPEVTTYLEAENAYTDAVLAHTENLQEKIFQEIKNRIKKDDSQPPYPYHGDYYYTRFEADKEYAIHCRQRGSLEAPEEILLDLNEQAPEEGYFACWAHKVSPDGNFYAFAVDTVGRRFFTVHFRDLRTGEFLADAIPGTTYNIAWANDSRTLFYSKQDPETLRYDRIYRHTLGTDPAEDVLVYQESDETFNCFVYRTKSERYLMIGSEQTVSAEYYFLDADHPTGELQLIQPREREHEYQVDHLGDHFFIRTNWDAQNFRLMRAPVAHPTKEHWEEVIAHRSEVLLQGFELLDDYLVLSERSEGLPRLHILRWDGAGEHYLDFGEPVYDAYLDVNLEAATENLRYGYTSLTTPRSVYDYNLRTREKTLLKRDEVLGGYEPDDYQSERLWAEARDGTRVPISVVYGKDLERDGQAPLLLYAYGAYGISWDASFSRSMLSLLERGFVCGIAHVRGGDELGRQWYDDGKLLKKMNTFTDFIDCAQFLIDQGYTSSDRLFAEGGSAGGLLVGAVANMAPELFHGILAEVPFVDVVTTMLDESIPLTTGEYDEWGNPNEKVYYDYMLSYSPYDQVAARDYPHILVTCGLHDSQVQYWEPAKWVAKLRAMKTDENLLLLHTNMEAGHTGTSGRFRRYREAALNFAFMLDRLGITE